MTYTIKITDNQTELAQSLLFYLKSLAKSPEYSFLEIQHVDDNQLDDELIKELEQRFEHYQANKNNYSDWENIKHKYINV
ncbi:MAG: hypothetical protein RO257_11505 [Candidatus Kapabacteria bacterium]|nr:hypothetical protein [Candidatus Kapabacteria bacterium]